ncbi:MAG: cytochrome c oxidase subunit II [Anaerolineae bacterium]
MDLGRNNSNNNGVLLPVIGGVALVLIIGGFLIAQLTGSAFPVQASAESEQIDALFSVLLGIGGAVFLLVQGLLVYSVIRFRRREGDESDGPTIHGNVLLELIWTAIPAVIVLGLVIYSYIVWVDIREPKDNELVVQAVGQRYAWTFGYYEPRLDCEGDQVDERLDCETRTVNPNINSNILHTYSGRPVRMVMNTTDVIHSFWVPTMRIKQDLLPGRTTEIRFTPTEPGEYRVVCTELCGAGHGQMYAAIIVHDSEETYLANFLDPAVESVVVPPADPVQLGGQLLASGTYPCSGCHVLQDEEFGISWNGNTGPSLEGLGDRAGNRVAGQSAEEYIFVSLYDTDAYLVPGYGNLMLQFQHDDASAPAYMPKEDAQAIVAYLCTQTTSGESACDLDNLAAFAESY